LIYMVVAGATIEKFFGRKEAQKVMAISGKRIVLWRRHLENQPGTLAKALSPFAESEVNLKVVMGYVFPNDPSKAVLEVYPVTSKEAQAAARKGGLSEADSIHCVLVEGDDKAGLWHAFAAALAEEKINLRFAIAQSVSRRFTGVFGFDEELAANAALKVIKRVASAVQPVRRKAARKTTRSETLRLVGKTRKTKTTRTTLRKAAQKKAATRGRKTGAVRAKSHKTAGKATARPVKRTTRKATTGRKRGR